MPTVPSQFAANHVTTLRRSMTSGSQSSGIIGDPLREPLDPETMASWQILGPQLLRFSKKVRGRVRSELIYFATASVDSTTKVITFGTATRNCEWKDGATITSLGDGYKWPSNTLIELVWSHFAAENVPYKDQANTFVGDQTVQGNLVVSGQKYVDLGDLTTAQETSLASSIPNGSVWHNTDLGVLRQKLGGSISSIETGATSNAADGTAGKVDLATAAEVAAGTATDGTSGAPNVIPVAIVKKTSSGAVEGTVPALNSAVAVDRTIGGLGTVSGTAFGLLANGTTSTGPTQTISPGTAGHVLTSNGPSALPSMQAPSPLAYSKVVYLNGVASATSNGSGGTSRFDFATHGYTIPANDVALGTAYEIEALIICSTATSSVFTAGIAIAGTDYVGGVSTAFNTSNKYFLVRGFITGEAAAGAAVDTRVWGTSQNTVAVGTTDNLINNSRPTLATNGTLAITFSGRFGTGNAGHSTSVLWSRITRHSTTAS